MSYYKIGDQFKWFVGKVIDNNDEEKLGRVKIRVIGDQTGDFEDSISDDDLLWAWPISSIQSSSLHKKKIQELEGFSVPNYMGGIGLSPTGISIGTYVFGFYVDGFEQNVPMIFGTYHKMSQYPEPREGVTTDSYSDVSPLARGEWDSDFTNSEETAGQILPKEYVEDGRYFKEPKSAYKTQYPYNTVFTTKSGHAIEIDDTPGAERIHIYHKSGSYEEIDKEGRRVLKTVDDDYEILLKKKRLIVKGETEAEFYKKIKLWARDELEGTVEKKVKIEAKEDAQVRVFGEFRGEVKRDANIKVSGDLNADISGNVRVRSNGTLQASVSGDAQVKTSGSLFLEASGSINIQAGGVINIDGSKVNLNGGEGSAGPSFNMPAFEFEPIGSGSGSTGGGSTGGGGGGAGLPGEGRSSDGYPITPLMFDDIYGYTPMYDYSNLFNPNYKPDIFQYNGLVNLIQRRTQRLSSVEKKTDAELGMIASDILIKTMQILPRSYFTYQQLQDLGQRQFGVPSIYTSAATADNTWFANASESPFNFQNYYEIIGDDPSISYPVRLRNNSSRNDKLNIIRAFYESVENPSSNAYRQAMLSWVESFL